MVIKITHLHLYGGQMQIVVNLYQIKMEEKFMKVNFNRKKFLDYYRKYYEQNMTCFVVYSGDIENVSKILHHHQAYKVSSVKTDKLGNKLYLLDGLNMLGFMPACWFNSGIFRL